MRPLTETLPKYLLPVEGRPFADYHLKWLKKTGVTRILLSVGYRSEMIRDYVQDGVQWGLEVAYVEDGIQPLGTGGAIRQAYEKGLLEEQFLVTYGDSFLPVDFSLVWNTFRNCKKPALMSVFRNDEKKDKSNINFQDGKILLYDKFYKPEDASQFQYIDYGLLGISRDWILRRIPEGKNDIADLLHALSQEGELGAWESPTRFFEVGSREGLSEFSDWVKKNGNL